MPSTPRYDLCHELGCKNPSSKLNRFCLEHGGKDKHPYNPKYNKQADRAKSNARYNTKQWEVLRIRQLSRYPLCIGCQSEGRVVPATVVDHLFAWTHLSEQAFYINRFQSLCATHHATKTQLEHRGIYRAFGMPAHDYSLGDYARVVGVNDPSI